MSAWSKRTTLRKSRTENGRTKNKVRHGTTRKELKEIERDAEILPSVKVKG